MPKFITGIVEKENLGFISLFLTLKGGLAALGTSDISVIC
jgi:hypothetical protein